MQEHITEKISAYLDHEMPKEERQAIAEHLLQCEKCRDEHDRIKLGAALASHLKRADAPENLWNEIENALDAKRQPQISPIPAFSFLGSRGLAAAALLIGLALATVVYLGLAKNESTELVKNEPMFNQNERVETPPASTPDETLTNRDTVGQIPSNANSNIISPDTILNTKIQPENTSTNLRTLPKTVSNQKAANQRETNVPKNNLPAWNVETLAGTPTAGNEAIGENGKLSVGEFLETDANSRARGRQERLALLRKTA